MFNDKVVQTLKMPGSHQVYFTVTPAEDPNAESDQQTTKYRTGEEDVERYGIKNIFGNCFHIWKYLTVNSFLHEV